MLGVGSPFSILMLPLAMLGGLAACSTGEASENAEGAVLNSEGVSAERAGGEPQQVVQRMVGTVTLANASPAQSASMAVPSAPAGAAVAGMAAEARASAAGDSRASSGSLAPRSNAAETITSKHLEAELNRLEAELAN